MTHPIDLDELERKLRDASDSFDDLATITWAELYGDDLIDRLRHLTAALLEIRNGNHSRQEARSIADGALNGTWEKPE